jgi:hypothetical protein
MNFPPSDERPRKGNARVYNTAVVPLSVQLFLFTSYKNLSVLICLYTVIISVCGILRENPISDFNDT